jgi:cytoskeletal protein CcmA (bactofilin family)
MIGTKDQKGVPGTEEVNAFLGRGTTFDGKMSFDGMFRLDGKFKGEIVSGDSLIIGETGEVDAQIKVNSLIVNGKLTGGVTASIRIEINPPGKVLGDIKTPVLVISEGAVFEGNCQMEKKELGRDEKVSILKPPIPEVKPEKDEKEGDKQEQRKPGPLEKMP